MCVPCVCVYACVCVCVCGGGGGGGTSGVGVGGYSPVFDRIALDKGDVVMKNFLIMSPLWRDFKEFTLKYYLSKIIKKKTAI